MHNADRANQDPRLCVARLPARTGLDMNRYLLGGLISTDMDQCQRQPSLESITEPRFIAEASFNRPWSLAISTAGHIGHASLVKASLLTFNLSRRERGVITPGELDVCFYSRPMCCLLAWKPTCHTGLSISHPSRANRSLTV